MKLSQAREAAELAWAMDLPLLVWGPPGVGKSSMWKAFAQARFGDDWKKHVVDWRLTELESVDMRGTPRERDGYTFWAPPIELPIEGNDRVPDEGLLILDELPQAKPDVKNVAARLVLERRVGEARLKKGWRIGAAGNRMGDASGTSPMPKHLDNRFWHVEVDVSIDEWITNFAEPTGIDERVIAYLKYKPAALMAFDPRSREAAFASPRSWEAVSKMLNGLGNKADSMDAALLGEFVAGHVGKAYGMEFAAFLRTIASMVSIDQILLDPDRAPVASEPSICYALATGLAAHVNRSTIGAAFKYLARMSKEFQFVFGYKVKRMQPNLQNTKAFVTFAAVNADFL